MRINVVVIEDEKEEALKTKQYLDKFIDKSSHELNLQIFENANSFFASGIDIAQVNLFLLDIILENSENGVEIARKIRTISQDVIIMFITKTVDYAINGYEVGAIDYVLKPLTYEDFALKLKKAMRYIIINSNRTIVFKHRNGLLKLRENEIYYIEVIKHYLEIHTIKGEYTVRGTMRDCEQAMGPNFSRTSNSFIVNLKYVDQILTNDVIVRGETIPLTKLRKKAFVDAFSAYVGAV